MGCSRGSINTVCREVKMKQGIKWIKCYHRSVISAITHTIIRTALFKKRFEVKAWIKLICKGNNIFLSPYVTVVLINSKEVEMWLLKQTIKHAAGLQEM